MKCFLITGARALDVIGYISIRAATLQIYPALLCFPDVSLCYRLFVLIPIRDPEEEEKAHGSIVGGCHVKINE